MHPCRAFPSIPRHAHRTIPPSPPTPPAPQESPTRIDGLPDDVVQVAAAKFHSAALTHDGRVFTWGVGRSGRLGHPEADVHSGYRAVILPREVAALRRVRVAQVAVGKNHSVCCTHDGELYAWGSNAEGQLGLPGEVQAAEPRRVPLAAPRDPAASARARARVVAVAAASAHTAAVTSSGALLTCGANDARQLGYLTPDAPGSPSLRAVEALRDRRVIGTAAARLHTLALTADGEVLSFGHGSPAPHRVPLPRLHPTAARPPRAVLVTAGRAHSSALLAGGLVAMWRSWEPSAPAQLVGGPLAGRTVTHIAAGRTRTAAVTSDGRVFVWEGPCETAGLAAEVDDAVTPGAKAGAGAGAGLTTPPARAGAGAGGDASAQNSGARGARGGRGGTSGRGAGVGVEGVAVEGVDGGARVVRVAVGEKHSLLIQSWAAPVASGPGAALLERSSAGFELPRDAREASGAEGEGRGRRRDSDGSWASLEAGVFEGFNAVESEKAEGEGEGGWYPGHSWDGPLSGVGRGGHGGGAPVWWRRWGARGAGWGDVPAVGE